MKLSDKVLIYPKNYNYKQKIAIISINPGNRPNKKEQDAIKASKDEAEYVDACRGGMLSYLNAERPFHNNFHLFLECMGFERPFNEKVFEEIAFLETNRYRDDVKKDEDNPAFRLVKNGRFSRIFIFGRKTQRIVAEWMKEPKIKKCEWYLPLLLKGVYWTILPHYSQGNTLKPLKRSEINRMLTKLKNFKQSEIVGL